MRPGSGHRIDISQKDREILDRLFGLFGGSVWPGNSKKSVGQWTLSGPRGRGFILTIFTFLSQRRRKRAVEWLRKDDAKGI